ncbi:MAG TPA: efflux RND transporter periplasmic adaptor subunit, partial [Acidobacteriaceae bacterium]|nr:efflux RND transporter periplasmic adaptor subunit [Acidobacteriaceae bacterium]
MYISKRTAVLVVVIFVVIAAIWVGFNRHANEPASAATTANTTAANDAPSAAVATVQLRPAVSSITVPGVFQAYQDVLVHAKVSGYVKHIFVDIGDQVHTGQVLAILEIPELNAQVDAATAAVMRDKSEIERTHHDESRAVALHGARHSDYARLEVAATKLPGLVAQQELDDKQAQDLSSEAQVDAAKSAYAAAQAKMSEDEATLEHYKALQAYSYVRAPFDGVVTFRYADTGALIAAGTAESTNAMPIVRLAQSGVLRLRMPVPESDADYMRIGGPAVVRVQTTGERINTKIVRFTRSMDRSTRTMLTEVDIPNKDLHLAPGMYADTTFPLRRDGRAMMLPIDAIVEGDQPYVLVVDDTNHVVNSP